MWRQSYDIGWYGCQWNGLTGVTADRRHNMKSEVYRSILTAHIEPNAAKLIEWHFTVQIHNHPKHTVKASIVI